jgi:hypothetical protein
MKRISKRKYKSWAPPIRLLMGERDWVIEEISKWAVERTKHLRKKPARPPRELLAEAVAYLRSQYPNLDVYKNRETPTNRWGDENACAFVAAAFRRAGFKGVTDRSVENSWYRSQKFEGRKGGQTSLIEVP